MLLSGKQSVWQQVLRVLDWKIQQLNMVWAARMLCGIVLQATQLPVSMPSYNITKIKRQDDGVC